MKNLYLRGNTFYYRLTGSVGGIVWNKRGSLETSDPIEAQAKLAIIKEHKPNMMNAPKFAERLARKKLIENALAQQGAQPDIASIVQQAVQAAVQALQIPKTTVSTVSGKPVPSIEDAMKQWRAEKIGTGAWTKGTAQKHGYVLDIFLELLDNPSMPVTEYSRKDALSYVEALKHIPPDRTRKAQWRDMPIKDVIKQNTDDLPLASTTNGIVTLIGGFFAWAVLNDWIDKNPFTNMRQKKVNITPKRGFTIEELNKILAGAKNDFIYQYWLPRVALFSGLRLAEITQLTVTDIITTPDGVLAFDVNTIGTKQLKNAAARRIVPIHSELIRLGFIGYVDAIRAQHNGSLWMDFKSNGWQATVGRSSQWFGDLKKKLGFDKSVSFHSLRHNFSQGLKEAGVSIETIDQLTGHVPTGSMTSTRYTVGFKPVRLKDEVEKLKYEGLIV